jgi:DNA polymerase-4
MRREIDRLARRAAAALGKKGLLARTVTLKVRYADFTTVTRRHTAELPTRDAGAIAARALLLLERTDAARRPVRLLGVGVQGLVGERDLPFDSASLLL